MSYAAALAVQLGLLFSFLGISNILETTTTTKCMSVCVRRRRMSKTLVGNQSFSFPLSLSLSFLLKVGPSSWKYFQALDPYIHTYEHTNIRLSVMQCEDYRGYYSNQGHLNFPPS